MDPVRWTAAMRIEWRPILPYSRRREELIDWFDASIDLTGFSEDNNEFLGIEVGDTQRLVIQRDSLSLLLNDPKDDVSRLGSAIAGALEILQPTEPRLTRYLSTWSAAIDGEYDERRGELARRTSGVPEAIDCAIVIDVPIEAGLSQAEYGIVTDEELKRRLSNPDVGRLGRQVGMSRPPIQVTEALPPVSLFAEAFWLVQRPGILASEDTVLDAVRAAENHSRGLVLALQRGLG